MNGANNDMHANKTLRFSDDEALELSTRKIKQAKKKEPNNKFLETSRSFPP